VPASAAVVVVVVVLPLLLLLEWWKEDAHRMQDGRWGALWCARGWLALSKSSAYMHELLSPQIQVAPFF
jgi:hypothetical protein